MARPNKDKPWWDVTLSPEVRKALAEARRSDQAARRSANRAKRDTRQIAKALAALFSGRAETRAGNRSLLARAFQKAAPSQNRPREAAVAIGGTPELRPSGRPISPEGKQSFHFSIRQVSKSPAAAASLSALSAGTTAAPVTKAAANQAYIEREEALDHVPLAHSTTAPEAALDASRAAPQGLDAAEWSAARSDAARHVDYTERDGAIDTVTADSDEVTAMFGTIGDTPEDRRQFWTLVEAHERTPGDPVVHIDPTTHMDWWREAMDDTTRPDFLTWAFTKGHPSKVTLSDSQYHAFALWLDAHPLPLTKTKKDPSPIKIGDPRGGRVQTRLIFSLPYELSPAARLDLCREFARVFEEKGLPYWAVLHKPSGHNDPRNFHMHLSYYDRPAKKRPNGLWDFEPTGWDKRNACYKYAARQPKDRDVVGRDWPYKLRCRFADIANTYLEREGHQKRLDPRTYAEMGIAKKPEAYLGPVLAALERRDIATGVTITAGLELSQKIIARSQAQYTERLTTAKAVIAPHRSNPALRGEMAEYLILQREIAKLARDRALYQEAVRASLARPTAVLNNYRRTEARLLDEFDRLKDTATRRRVARQITTVRAKIPVAQQTITDVRDQLAPVWEDLEVRKSLADAARARARQLEIAFDRAEGALDLQRKAAEMMQEQRRKEARRAAAAVSQSTDVYARLRAAGVIRPPRPAVHQQTKTMAPQRRPTPVR